MHLYSNPDLTLKPLLGAHAAASAVQRPEGSRTRRSHQHRLDEQESVKLISDYQQALVKELAIRFDVNRKTVTSLLVRHGVELRQPGLTPIEVAAAVELYVYGWSVAKLGQKFGVDGTTVRRSLRAVGVLMRSPNER